MVTISEALGEKNEYSSQKYRLPCRGCTASCKNYSRCGGKPWRNKPEVSNKSLS